VSTEVAAELSSLSSTLDHLMDRVTALAERRTHGGGEPDDVAVALYEVERSLQEARRRLERAVGVAG
jgi:predicted  nucleic acid-binding Zn-ribbon protein